ncbi:NAD(P)H-dependent oxidoreductase [Caulobacter sp. KR2-114]|uniref:NAD(P)H-dependent oxidoreductase n=1 Tax=Caulobacter sp. KR2-114 TaxID=3400912 RepID=UPI003C031863
MTRILLINGHPDPDPRRFCAALADVYAAAAVEAGHEVRHIDVGAQDFPLIRTADAFAGPATAPSILAAQDAVLWCEHLVIVHPLWQGGAPALLKGFLEQVFRYGFAIPAPGTGSLGRGLLSGRSARLIVTMGMPAAVYALAFGAFGTRALERGLFRLCGFAPVRRTLFGAVDQPASRQRMLRRVRRLGERGR